MSLQKEIEKWTLERLNPKRNDLLVQVSGSKSILSLNDVKTKYIFEYKSTIKKLYQEAKKNEKIFGVNPLCFVQNVLVWEWNKTRLETPLFFQSCSTRVNKNKTEISVELENELFVNPFLVKQLGLPKSIESIEELSSLTGNLDFEFELKAYPFLGNIHHYRFEMVRELEMLQTKKIEASNLATLLGEKRNNSYELKVSKPLLFSADTDQIKVFEVVKHQDCVVQGPPGTGKSQLIANLLVKAMVKENNVALVSEKTAALSVIYEKLKSVNLHHFCTLGKENKRSTAVLTSLKSTWKFLEQHVGKPGSNLLLSEQKIKALQFKMDRFKSDFTVGGIPFSEFNEKRKTLAFKNLSFEPGSLDLKEWNSINSELSTFLENGGANYSYCYIKNLHTYSIQQLESLAKRIKAIIKKIDQDLTLEALHENLKISALVTLFFYDEKPLNNKLLVNNSTEQKRFKKLYNQYFKFEEQIKWLEKEKKHWKKDLSNSEISDFISALTTTNRFNLKTRKKRKELSKLTKTNFVDYKQALENLSIYKKTTENLIEVKDKLRKLNLAPNEATLLAVKNVIDRANSSTNQIKELADLPQKELVQLKGNANHFYKLKEDLSFLKDMDSQSLVEILKQIESIIPFLIENHSSLYIFTNLLTELVYKYKTVDKIEETLYYSAWLKFKGLNPELASFDGYELNKQLNEIERLQKEERIWFAKNVIDSVANKFKSYHSILQTPAQKLTTQEKALKKQLRVGKSILVKEFSKSRQHKSVLELQNSEAKVWLDVLQPIKLMSPYQMAADYPLKVNSFDLVIFDEASQIPLANAFGSVFRAKRFMVAGDEHQMAPTSYFTSETNTIDLLHQAQYYLPKVKLTHHYRSSHPALISFSNQYFYENELKTFPKANAVIPFELIDAKGIYTEIGNIKEAKQVAKIITEKLSKNILDFGVVAFNEKQLKLIYEQLTSSFQIKLDEAVEEGVIFKSLENVQGDECNHLIISLGFAFNEKGNFNMRFGPINQENGYRRLNVLFSRAKEKITFVRSVKATDFKFSDNIGVDLLKKFMILIESKSNSKEPLINHLDASDRKLQTKLSFVDFDNLSELLTYHCVMKDRGWDMLYEI